MLLPAGQKKLTLLLLITGAVSAQSIHLPDYFPVQDGRQWVYEDEAGHLDTAVMHTNVPFAGNSAVSLSFGPNDEQYFSPETTGLYLLGMSNPTGTFSFDLPLGIAGLDANVDDLSARKNWRVTHLSSGTVHNWGGVDFGVILVMPNMTLSGVLYNDIVVIRTTFSRGSCTYYLAKNVGIVLATAQGSPSFNSRMLVNFLPTGNTVASPWRSGAPAFKLHIAGSACGMRSDLSFPMYSSLLRLKIFSPDGRLLLQRRFYDENNATVNLTNGLAPGRYIATLRDGSVHTSRVISILP